MENTDINISDIENVDIDRILKEEEGDEKLFKILEIEPTDNPEIIKNAYRNIYW